ncbi:ABC transporter permease [Flavimobilis sp. GY10621]|uniref:ABC transporter permease n=1 Tax=Flavimobilis rhizosphaerae TaxID=2775421 RepID=A0ABR9DR21_9MICO|nr:ABC transporter permease [Flavimobilis rhizosphaerae]MBD9699399.1 ABC transporter permease [Flavimobilis rhizosphaerae]
MKFYVRRITFYLVTLWAAISLNFFIPKLMPGNPADIFRENLLRQGGEITPAMEQTIQLLFGSPDDSLWEQYTRYWSNLLQWDLGVSTTKYPTPVTELLAEALPWTLVLVGTATVIAFVLGVGLGAWAGWKRGTWVDSLIPGSALLQSIPYFWLALVLVAVFSVNLGWFPIIGGYSAREFRAGPEMSWAFVSNAAFHAILPAATIVISSVGGWLIGMRNMMVATLSEDYVTTAEAKGLKPSRVFLTYATRNASLPSLAGFTITLGFVVAGSIVMEQVFSYPGIGKLMITAVTQKDFALMQGVFLVITLTVLAANFVMDIFYGLIDPRARQNV